MSISSFVGQFGTTVLADALLINYTGNLNKSSCECGHAQHRQLTRNLAIVDVSVLGVLLALAIVYGTSFKKMSDMTKDKLKNGLIGVGTLVFLFKVIYAAVAFSYLIKTSQCQCAHDTFTENSIRVYSYAFFGLQLLSILLVIVSLILQFLRDTTKNE